MKIKIVKFQIEGEKKENPANSIMCSIEFLVKKNIFSCPRGYSINKLFSSTIKKECLILCTDIWLNEWNWLLKFQNIKHVKHVIGNVLQDMDISGTFTRTITF